MKYRITLNDDDYLQFNIFYAYNSRGGKRSVRRAQIVFPIFTITLILLVCLNSGVSPRFFLIEMVVFAAFSAVCYLRMPKIMESSIRKNIEQIKRNGKLPYNAWSEIEFQDSMIVQRHEQGEFRLKYENIENIYLENDCIYIFHTALQALLIPYRCLGADKECVIEYLAEKRADLLHNVI